MSQIPSDINEKIWKIAERGDQRAADAFAEKNPAHAQEMADRMRMVNGVKNMRAAVAPTFVPPFKPKYMGMPKKRKWRRIIPAVFGIGALATASFYVFQNFSTPLPEMKDKDTIAPTTRAVRPDGIALPPIDSHDDADADSPRATLGPKFKPSANSDLMEITMTDTSFQRGMRDIGAHWHIGVDFPPKSADPVVKRFDAFGKNGMDFLRQLAEQQGYSVYEHGRGRVLVQPDSLPPPDSN